MRTERRHLSPERRPPIPETLTQPITSDALSDVVDPKRAAVMDTLQRGVEQVMTQEGFQAYLKMLSKFWQYSANNCLLIMQQRPDATLVNSYDRWKQLGRQVTRGERGIKIFFPYKQMMELVDENGELKTQLVTTGFGVGNVFDIKQTDGKPLAKPPRAEEKFGATEIASELDKRLSLWAIGQGVRMEKRPLVSSRGVFNPVEKAITLSSALPDNDGKLKTLVHELTHYAANHDGFRDHDDGEVVAEGSAYVFLQHYDIPTDEYSFPYIAAFARSPDALKRNLSGIQRLSSTLIKAVEGEDPEITREWL